MKLWAKKSLGQHFLNSKHVLEQIITASKIQKEETVLEIGPGTGILTAELLKSGAKVIAIEKDQRACEPLRQKFAMEVVRGELEIIQGDILDENSFKDHETGLSKSPFEKLTNGSYAIVANIPYYITGAILEKFLEHAPRPNRMILLVQREVAERIVARDGKESILSISVKAFGTPSIVARVPPGAFTPPPTVESAILAIHDISDTNFVAQNIDISWFFTLVKTGFAHKRKMLMSNIIGALSHEIGSKEALQIAWKNIGLEEKVRAEDVTVGQWLDLASHVKKLP